ncbi:MAG: NAD(P)-dependent oxidoreductase [Clostridia bacterium]|nr:NAD(P)-dependent oxidoreductase [Clostridia bacterium]
MEIDEIKLKASHCLVCLKKSCQSGCPLQNDTMEAIKLVKEERYKEAYELFCETTVLQSICGRICPHEKQCQGKCIRRIKSEPVQIGSIEAFLGDLAIENNWQIPKNNEIKNKKVAVIGSGPSSLTCAAFLAREGYSVTIYEKYHELGGLLNHGIPEFRLPKEILKKAIHKILDLGIDVIKGVELGKDYSIEQLQENYDAIYLGIGANVSTKMNIEGEELAGVYGGNELLENNTHPDYKNKCVAVIGGGNVAMDTARTIKKLGAKKVSVIYRRAEEQMPAERKEIEDAKKEGIEFLFQNNIVKIIGNNKVEKIECIKTELKKKEGDDRLSPVNVEGSNYILDMDYVVMAVGSKPEEKLLEKLNIKLNKWGQIEIDENNMTSMNGVFAGGDIVGAKSTVAWAAKSGRDASYSIIKYLNHK